MTEVVGRARALDRAAGLKREADVPVERLQGAPASSADPEPPVMSDAQEIYQVSHEELVKIAVDKSSEMHPLLQVPSWTR